MENKFSDGNSKTKCHFAVKKSNRLSISLDNFDEEIYNYKNKDVISPTMAATLGFGNKTSLVKENMSKVKKVLPKNIQIDKKRSMELQKILRTTDFSIRENLFNSIKQYIVSLSKNAYGNYLVQDFFIYGSDEQKSTIIEELIPFVDFLSFNKYASRVIQSSIKICDSFQKERIVFMLKPVIANAMSDMNATHIIQALIEKDSILFDYLCEDPHVVIRLAKDVYGSRVIQKFLIVLNEPKRKVLSKILTESADELICNRFGNYLIQTILRFGSYNEVSEIMDVIKQKFIKYSNDKNGSNVVELSFIKANNADRKKIIDLIIGNKIDDSLLIKLVRSEYGNYVIQKVLKNVNNATCRKLVEKIRATFEFVETEYKCYMEKVISQRVRNRKKY